MRQQQAEDENGWYEMSRVDDLGGLYELLVLPMSLTSNATLALSERRVQRAEDALLE